VGSNPIARSNIEGCELEYNQSQSSLYKWRRGQVVRQGSAKSSSGVQIPSTPHQKQTDWFAFLFKRPWGKLEATKRMDLHQLLSRQNTKVS
jgi:hypothetical protein